MHQMATTLTAYMGSLGFTKVRVHSKNCKQTCVVPAGEKEIAACFVFVANCCFAVVFYVVFVANCCFAVVFMLLLLMLFVLLLIGVVAVAVAVVVIVVVIVVAVTVVFAVVANCCCHYC